MNHLGAFLNMCYPDGKLSDKIRMRSKDLEKLLSSAVCLKPLCTVGEDLYKGIFSVWKYFLFLQVEEEEQTILCK